MTEKLKLDTDITALQDSVAHWTRLARGQQFFGEGPGSASCALCRIYLEPGAYYSCIGCPVFEKTGNEFCVGTPYALAKKEIFSSHAFRAAAQKEVEFLQSLLDEKLLATKSSNPE